MATPPPGTRTGLAKSPSPIAPTLDTVIVPPRFGISVGVRPHGTCRPRWERCLSVDANEYTECVETFRIVGVYRPVGVDKAIEISAPGRIVSVGFGGGDEEDGDIWGVIEERNKGHSAIALESVLSRIGR